jgi:hypothetical protein
MSLARSLSPSLRTDSNLPVVLLRYSVTCSPRVSKASFGWPSLDEVVGKPVGRVREVLVAKHLLGKGAYRLHVLFRRRHAAIFGGREGAAGTRSACATSFGRCELQHLVDGETAPAVGRGRVRTVAELGSQLSLGLLMAHSVGHPDPRSDRVADTLSRAE